MSSQTSSPASYIQSDTFQQPFAPEGLKGRSSQAESASQGATSAFAESSFTGAEPQGATSAFADSAFATAQQPQHAQHAAGDLNQTDGQGQLQKPESTETLKEAGVQPLPYSAFAAEHKQEPTAFAVPTVEEVLPESAPAPAATQDHHRSSTEFSSEFPEPVQSSQQHRPGQRDQIMPNVQQSANFATHHEPDFTDLNPLSPKVAQEPTSATAYQSTAQRNPFESGTNIQQPSGAAAAADEDDFAEPAFTAQRAMPAVPATQSAVTPQQAPALQQTNPAQQQSQSSTYPAVSHPTGAQDQADAAQQKLSGLSIADSQPTAPQQHAAVSEPVQPSSARIAPTQQSFASEQQQPGSARSHASQQSRASEQQQQLGSGSVGVVTGQPAGPARPQALALEQQQLQQQQMGAAGAAAASKADDLFVKPTDFDEAVDTGTGGSKPTVSGVLHTESMMHVPEAKLPSILADIHQVPWLSWAMHVSSMPMSSCLHVFLLPYGLFSMWSCFHMFLLPCVFVTMYASFGCDTAKFGECHKPLLPFPPQLVSIPRGSGTPYQCMAQLCLTVTGWPTSI